MTVAGIIPARYASTRFPGKPLAVIEGKTMIERVYIQASKVLKYVAVATDDKRIEREVKRFGGNVIMTSKRHKSGTDRCAEAATVFEKQTKKKFSVVINIQGDEPFIDPSQFKKILSCFSNKKTQIATLVKKIQDETDIFNPNVVKVVVDKNKKAIYFSRSSIPYIRDAGPDIKPVFLKHIGMYAFRRDVLEEITRLRQSSLELAESLEQLRWIENGYKISVEITKKENISIDVPGDIPDLGK